MPQPLLIAWIECATTAGETACHEGGLTEVRASADLLDRHGPRKWRDAIDASDPTRALTLAAAARIADLLLADGHSTAPGAVRHHLASLTWVNDPDSH